MFPVFLSTGSGEERGYYRLSLKGWTTTLAPIYRRDSLLIPSSLDFQSRSLKCRSQAYKFKPTKFEFLLVLIRSATKTIELIHNPCSSLIYTRTRIDKYKTLRSFDVSPIVKIYYHYNIHSGK